MTCAPYSRAGRRRKFGEADKRQILEEAIAAGCALRRGRPPLWIAERVLFRWKQELTVTAPAFVSVEIGAIEIDRRRRFWSVPTPIEHRSLHESASLNF
jgi:hypothetical protein